MSFILSVGNICSLFDIVAQVGMRDVVLELLLLELLGPFLSFFRSLESLQARSNVLNTLFNTKDGNNKDLKAKERLSPLSLLLRFAMLCSVNCKCCQRWADILFYGDFVNEAHVFAVELVSLV